jgi:hypothetical protein
MPYANPEKQKAYQREYYRTRPRRRRDTWLRCMYGISIEQYDLLFSQQDGACAVCHRRERTLSVDHDHQTGQVRGLLCRKCNAAIGALGDSVETVSRALDYLKGVKRG